MRGFSIHEEACWAIRLPIQSMVLSARASSSSLQASSTSPRAENRILKLVWVTGVRPLVRVVTKENERGVYASEQFGMSVHLAS